MPNALMLERMSPELVKVAERAQRESEAQFHALAHRIDLEALRRAYHRQRKAAAVGVDGITKAHYGQELDINLRDLHERLRQKLAGGLPYRTLGLTRRGLETWQGRDIVTLADERASQQGTQTST